VVHDVGRDQIVEPVDVAGAPDLEDRSIGCLELLGHSGGPLRSAKVWASV
jgi:hypothetical protein